MSNLQALHRTHAPPQGAHLTGDPSSGYTLHLRPADGSAAGTAALKYCSLSGSLDAFKDLWERMIKQPLLQAQAIYGCCERLPASAAWAHFRTFSLCFCCSRLFNNSCLWLEQGWLTGILTWPHHRCRGRAAQPRIAQPACN